MFDWLGALFEWCGSLFPRLVVIRATHEGIKWKNGHEVVRLMPGRHIYWPIMSDVELCVVARQPANMTEQTVTTRDGIEVIVSGVIIYRIKDIVRVMGERNYNVDETVSNVTLEVIFNLIMGHTYEELREGFSDPNSKLSRSLTLGCRKRLSRFGVHVHQAGLTDFAKTKVYRVVGNSNLT